MCLDIQQQPSEIKEISVGNQMFGEKWQAPLIIMRRGYYVCAENWLGMFRAYFFFVLFDSQSRRRPVPVRTRGCFSFNSRSLISLTAVDIWQTFSQIPKQEKKTYLTFQTYITTTTTQQPNEKREIEELYYTQSLLLN
jgi:hypothetical protein